MAGEVSCRVFRPLFHYMNERALPLADLFAGLRLESHFFFSPENWVSESLFSELLDRAVAISGDNELIAAVGAAAGQPGPFSPVPPQVALADSAESALEEAQDYLCLLQRGSQVLVHTRRPGYVVVECVPPPGQQRGFHLCSYMRHMLGAIPRPWHPDQVQVREIQCAVPPQDLRWTSGHRCAVDANGTVWQVPPQGSSGSPRAIGQLREDGTCLLDGVLYGADRCVYEIRWPPRGKLRQFLGPLGLAPLLRRLLLRQLRRQGEIIRTLREQIRRLNLTTEARILERTEDLRVKARQMALLEQTSRRFASLVDSQALAQEVARTLREEFGYHSAAMYLLEGETWTLCALSTGDNSVEQRVGHRLQAEPQAVERLRHLGRPLAQHDLSGHGHLLGLPRLGRGQSCLTAPLIASDTLLGVLDLQCPRPGRFESDDALILHLLATQAAIAMERSRLYREEQRARRTADAMAMLARILNKPLELDQVLPLALDQLRRVLCYDVAAVFLLEDEQTVLSASRGLSPTAQESLRSLLQPMQRETPVRALQATGPALFSLRDMGPEEPVTALAHLASWLSAPLTSRGTIVGQLLLAARQPGAFGQEDLRTVEDFARQVAAAIENARLYERIRRDRDRLESLYAIGRELYANLEIEQVLRHVLDLGRASVGATAGSIILLDSAHRPTHHITLQPNESVPSSIGDVLERGAAGWVLREQQSLLIEDAATDPRWLVLPDDPWATRSAIVAPLIAQGQVIGVLTVIHPQPGRFKPEDLDMLSSIAGQASSVVQRARLFAAIRDERARLRAVIEGTADAVIILDEEGHVRHINRSAADLFGAALEGEGADQPLDQILHHPALRALRLSGQKDQVSANGSCRRAEVPLPDGRTLYAALTPIPSVGSVITMQDVTHLKKLDRMKSDFVADVSHDLRTPLGAVQGFAEMLELAGPLSEEQSHLIERIISTVEGMSALVENLLDLAKIEARVEVEMAPCQLAAVIAESVDQMTGPAAMKPVSLHVDVPDDLPLVRGNGRRLGQVVNNLLDNAIKYAPPHGQVTLRARTSENGVQVEVSDNGPGIPAADLPHIFAKFYRVREGPRQQSGTGLGLSIAQSIVQAHGGQIWAQSKEGEGATFSFRIPLWTGIKNPSL